MGNGLEYQTGVPRAGSVTRLDISLGGVKATPDVTIEELSIDFNRYADVVLAPSPIDHTMALWAVTLAGDDQIDFGTNTGAKNLSIQFAGDGYEAPMDGLGGNDVMRGDIGQGAVSGDYIVAGAGRAAMGGDDDIRLLNSKTAVVSGDILQSTLGSVFLAGNDRIHLDREGTVVGDASNVYGVLVAGHDTIYGSEDGDSLTGDVAYALAGSSVVFGNDVIHGGDGNDFIRGDYAGNASTNFRGGNDKLYGDAGEDSILGEEGNDYLDGGTGNDNIGGGYGNDTIRGGQGKDVITGAQGIDTADYSEKTTSVSIVLDLTGSAVVKVNGVAEDHIAEFENLIGGSAGDKLYGPRDYTSNRLDGRGGNDTLDAGGGKDTLIGGAGSDKLRGGDGLDQFVFDAKLGATNVDTILDFQHGVDDIVLDDAIFKALGSKFEKDEFLARSYGHDATKASHNVIYDQSTGTLWYDSDGVGGHAAIKFAQLGTTSSHPTNLSWDDFAIV